MTLEFKDLKCEYLRSPLGVETKFPRFTWLLNSRKRGQHQKAYQIIVSSRKDLVVKGIGDIWDSSRVDSDETVNIVYSGKTLESCKRYFWRVQVWDENNKEFLSDISSFETALLSEKDWKARWITKKAPKTFESNGDWDIERFVQANAMYFRKTFSLKDKRISKARVYITGIGYYELRINGKKVSDKVLDPAQTDYTKIALYSTYDITALLEEKNAIGVILGNGRHIKAYGYDFPKLIVQIEIEYENGGREVILSDENWKVSHGPLKENGIYFGERYDARLEMGGWDKPNFDDSKWENAVIVDGPKLSAQVMPPIRCIEAIKPKRLYSPREGVYVCDFGRNFTGWVKLRVKGAKGKEIRLRYAEVVYKDGNLNLSTIRNAETTDLYILRGEGLEVYEPKFTYHGFRYVEVEGFPGVPTLENVEGQVVHTDVRKVGDFYCSNELINKIHNNILRAQLSNLMSIPTDCPQRDERLGWMGDAQISAEEAIYNFDMVNFYEKWLNDIKLSQREDGSIPDVVPPYRKFYPADPAWGTAYITIAWYLYWYYGDKKVLEEHYDNMKKYVEFLRTNAENGISKLGKYGDWCPPGSIFPKRTPVELTSTFYYYNDVLLLSKIADALKRDKEAKNYFNLSEKIKDAFNERFLTPNGYEVIKMSPIDQGTGQTSNVLPLFYNMVPKEREEGILKRLIDLIVNEHDYHLDTGIVGTKYIFDVLTENGYSDIAYKIATQESYPSFGYMVKKGATTLWERWEKLEGGGMNSHNHVMFGSIDAWFWKYLIGVSPLSAGWKKFKIKPYPVGDLRYISSSLKTVRGKIELSWERSENSFEVNLSIPTGCKAELHLPIFWKDFLVSENGKELLKGAKQLGLKQDIKFIAEKGNRVIFELNNGYYEFLITEMNFSER